MRKCATNFSSNKALTCLRVSLRFPLSKAFGPTAAFKLTSFNTYLGEKKFENEQKILKKTRNIPGRHDVVVVNSLNKWLDTRASSDLLL